MRYTVIIENARESGDVALFKRMPDPPEAGECRRPAHCNARFVENKGDTGEPVP